MKHFYHYLIEINCVFSNEILNVGCSMIRDDDEPDNVKKTFMIECPSISPRKWVPLNDNTIIQLDSGTTISAEIIKMYVEDQILKSVYST